jgi:putative ABC transport system permease protein
VAEIQRFRSIDQQHAGTSFCLIATETETMLRRAEERGKGLMMVRGKPIRPGELAERPQIVLSENAARHLGLDAGQKITLNAPGQAVVFEVRAVIVDYTCEKGSGFIDRSQFIRYWKEDSVDNFFVFLEQGANEEKAADGVRAALGGGAVFVTKTANLRAQLIEMLRTTFSYSRSVEIVTLLIALMGVIGTMVAAIIDRTREIGMLRAIGATSRQVSIAIIVEAGFLGFCAAVIGAAVGVIQCKLFFNTLLLSGTGWHLDFIFPWAATARISGLVIVTSAIAGGIPAWRASRQNIPGAVACE